MRPASAAWWNMRRERVQTGVSLWVFSAIKMFDMVQSFGSHFSLQTRRSYLAKLGGLTLAGTALPFAGCTSKSAPNASYVLLDGSKTDTAAMMGKVVLVNFWATSCVSCVAEMPEIAKLYTELAPKGYDTLAVAMSYDRPDFVQHFAKTRALPFKVAFDNTGAVAKAWGDVKVTPTSFLVGKQGQIAKTYVGKPHFDAMRREVLELLS
jgi:peroxiredoxin